MHPLLRFQEGDHLQLPPCARSRLAGGPWLETVSSAVAEGECAKVFVRPIQVGSAGVYNRGTSDQLEFVWNPAENDTLGLWLTRGGWHGHHHLALEPTNGAHDALALAAESGRCGIVDAGGSMTWDIRLRVGP